MPKLTKKFIDALQFSDSKTLIFWDDDLRGFGVRVSQTCKTYFVQSRVHGRNAKATIGRHGVFTPDTARDAARKLLLDMSHGIDPTAEKERQKALGVTLQEALEDYLKARQLKPVTRKDVIYTMNKHLKKWLALPLVSITPDMVVRLHRQLGATSPARANLAMRYLRSVLNFAAANYSAQDGSPLLAHNPVERLSAARLWYRVPRKTRFLQDHQIKPWMEAVLSLPDVPDREPGTGKHFPRLSHGDLARDFFLILLLTGLRRTEALNLTWRDVDLDAKILTVTDTKNHLTHKLPLPDYLYDLLLERKEKSGKYVLSGPDGTRFSAFRYAQARIKALTGIEVSPHDLRRTFATAASRLSISAYAVKMLLNHKGSNDVTGGYIQLTVEDLREPMQRICDFFLTKGGLKGGKVIQLPGRAANG